MNKNIENDDRRHAISKLAGPMNDPLIDPIAAIRRVSESITYCENWQNEYNEKLKKAAEKAKRAKTLEADWDDILEANRTLINEIKSRVEDEEIMSVSEILEKQKENEKKLKNTKVK